MTSNVYQYKHPLQDKLDAANDELDKLYAEREALSLFVYPHTIEEFIATIKE